MLPYTTYELSADLSVDDSSRFSMAIYVYEGNEYDNIDAIGLRMSFVLIERGIGVAQVENRKIPFMAPCIFCVNEQEHVIIAQNPENQIRVLAIHPNVINASLDYENIRKLPQDVSITVRQDRALLYAFIKDRESYIKSLTLGPITAQKIITAMDALQQNIQAQDSENWPCRSRAFVMQLLFMLESLYDTDSLKGEDTTGVIDEEFSPILSYVSLHYNEKITVEDVVSRFHISRNKMSKMFQHNLGETFLTYMNRTRVYAARRMLRETSLTVQEIMYHVGFYDQSHFLRTFKKYTGMSPSAYRESDK